MFKLILSFSLAVSTFAQSLSQSQSDDDLWHNMDTGSVWGTSNNLARNNPYYNTYRQISRQMNTYGPAQHLGKIYRGSYLNPELNRPRHRAFGFQSDFNLQDIQSGVFHYKPQGQKYKASEVHINEGLASSLGQEQIMPIGQYVQEDGTILIQTNGRISPCDPNPCRSVRMPMCTVVNSVTAKCSRDEDYMLTLTFKDPTGGTYVYNNMILLLVPAFHDGSEPLGCNLDNNIIEDSFYGGLHSACGVIPDPDFYDWAYEDHDPNLGDKTHILTMTDDGATYRDYTYQVIVRYFTDYLDVGTPQLTVEYNGEVKQVLSVPQADGVTDVDPNSDEKYYFFGCFRPQLGIVDTRGAGFFDDSNYVVDNTNGLQL